MKKGWMTTYLATMSKSTLSQSSISDERNSAPASEILSNDEIRRYSRQLVLPQFGVASQIRLKSSRILIVGLGGLGTPVALYLAGAGVGKLGLVERAGDTVEESNLHRQIAYSTRDIGQSKARALSAVLKERNADVDVVTHDDEAGGITPKNAVGLCSLYDIVVDCTDNVMARYVIGDACAVAVVPLVSGAAVGLAGQLTVLGVRRGISPCYRCIFPKAPPPHCVGSCDAAGVLGPVPGVIAALQAVETLKLATRFEGAQPLDETLLLFDATDSAFRSVKMRPRRPDCLVCAEDPSRFDVSSYDYEGFVQGKSLNDISRSDENTAIKTDGADSDAEFRITVQQFAKLRAENNGASTPQTSEGNTNGYTLIDVRPKTEFAICRLGDACNVPLSTLDACSLAADINGQEDRHRTILICRRGNASRRALHALRQAGAKNVCDVVGGLEQWHREIDKTFPTY